MYPSDTTSCSRSLRLPPLGAGPLSMFSMKFSNIGRLPLAPWERFGAAKFVGR